MSEKSAQTKKKLAKNADKIVIAVLALILAGLAYAWWQEQNNALGDASATGKPAALTDQLAESPALNMLSNMSANPTLENAPDIQRVAQLNMFDYTAIEAEKSLEAQSAQQLEQAKQLIESGQTDQARELLLQAKDGLAWHPDFKQTLDKVTTPTGEAAMTVDPAMSPDGTMPADGSAPPM